jgi:hypothetical protein
MASIEIPFAIGSQAWWSGPDYKTEYVTCDECGGSRRVIVLRHDGEQLSLKCHHCGPGYQDPMGSVKRTLPGFGPRLVTPTRVEMDTRDGKQRFRYYTDDGTGIIDDDRLHATREACQAQCDELTAEAKEGERRRELAQLTSNRDHLAFSVPYLRRELAEKRREVERLEEQLGIAKAKAKENKQ